MGLIQDTADNHLAWTDIENPSDGASHWVDITVVGGNVRVVLDGIERLNCTIEDYEAVLGRMFFTAATAESAYSNEHLIDNVLIYAGTPDTLSGVRGADGMLLDGEFFDGQPPPSGDGVPGGDFQYA